MKTEIIEVIERLCIELGYPHRKLDFNEYSEVLRKAHKIVYGTPIVNSIANDNTN